MKGDEDIVQALNHCANTSTDIHKCENCPLFGDYKDCMQRLINGANDLVRRLLGRNERAKKENKKLKTQNKSEVEEK